MKGSLGDRSASGKLEGAQAKSEEEKVKLRGQVIDTSVDDVHEETESDTAEVRSAGATVGVTVGEEGSDIEYSVSEE